MAHRVTAPNMYRKVIEVIKSSDVERKIERLKDRKNEGKNLNIKKIERKTVTGARVHASIKGQIIISGNKVIQRPARLGEKSTWLSRS